MSARTPHGTAVPAGSRRALLVLGLSLLGLLAGLAAAGPAGAIDDSTRPDARVTHGPSCRPGGVVVEVVAGTVPYAVTLATTRDPDGEDFAEVASGQTVVLGTGTVRWGETIDGWLEYRALDGSGTTWVDELDGYTFTRPAEEDCAAITAPPGPATVPGTEPLPPSTADEVLVSPGTVSTEPATESVAPRAMEPGGPAPAGSADAEAVETVEVAASAPVAASLARESSVAPAVAAAVALVAAGAGLARALAAPRMRRRTPTAGA